MTLPHYYGAVKLATWIAGLATAATAALFAMEPSVQIALIAIIPLTLTGVGTLWMQLLARKDAREIREDTKKSLANQDAMKTSIDGHFSELLASDQRRSVELIDKTDRLAHAEGKAEGAESERSRAKE
jgi:hypothetical protein